MDSKALFERSLRVAPGGVHSPVRAFKSVGGHPLFFKKGEGAYLESVEGDSYIDFCQSFGPNILGHRDPDVEEILRQTISLGWCFGACEPYSLELAEFVQQNIPWIERIRFVCSGTEAVMSALRVARAATGRDRILKFEGCYHGHVDALLVKAGSGLAGASAADSLGVPAEVASSTITVPLDDEEKLNEVLQKYRNEIAAVILEPLPANYGLLIQREEFIRKVTAQARQIGALVIFDEVISGFRVAFGGMAERLNIQPDLVTYGKILGGGLAVGAYGGRADLMDLVAPAGRVYQAGTLSANPLAMRTGLATLQKLIGHSVHKELEARTLQFTDRLRPALQAVGMDVTSYASIFWLHPKLTGPVRKLSQLPATMNEHFAKLFHACLQKGVYLAPSGYEVGFISYAHTDSVLELAIKKIEEAIGEMA